MARIKWLVVMVILLLMALFWDKCPYPDYGAMPFSIESYTVLDSILDGNGIIIRNGDTTYIQEGHDMRLYKNYLVTGYDNMTSVEHKIDSILPSLVDSTALNRYATRLYFFRKTNRCNNDYEKWNEEYTELESWNDCILFTYDIHINILTSRVVGIQKTCFGNPQESKNYSMIWNQENILKDSIELTKYSFDKVRTEYKNPGMEKLFDRLVELAKKKLIEQGEEVKEGYKRYHVR